MPRVREGVSQKQKSSIGWAQLDRSRIVADRFRQFVLLLQQLTKAEIGIVLPRIEA